MIIIFFTFWRGLLFLYTTEDGDKSPPKLFKNITIVCQCGILFTGLIDDLK